MVPRISGTGLGVVSRLCWVARRSFLAREQPPKEAFPLRRGGGVSPLGGPLRHIVTFLRPRAPPAGLGRIQRLIHEELELRVRGCAGGHDERGERKGGAGVGGPLHSKLVA